MVSPETVGFTFDSFFIVLGFTTFFFLGVIIGLLLVQGLFPTCHSFLIGAFSIG